MGDQSNDNIIDVKTNNNSSVVSKKEFNYPSQWKPKFKQAHHKDLDDSEREAAYMDYES